MSRAKTETRATDEVSAETAVVNANTAEADAAPAASGRVAEGRGAAGEPAPAEGSATSAAEGGAAAAPAGAASAAGDQAAGDQAAEEQAAETQADPARPDPAEPDRTTEGETAETEAAEPAASPAKPRPAWRRLPVLLLAVAVVLTGAGVWFTLEARSTAATPAAANLALTDVGATADVTSAVTLAMNRIFSYSYDRTDVTEKAAAAVLRGAAKDSYDKLFAEVRRRAPEQKLVLTSRVSAIAVQDLQNGHAKLLVFLDQSAVRADNNATDSAAAQLSVTAERTGDGWVVTELEPR
ncbi:hypothetical protein ILP97_36390 [Amycolatopsis sp. H6(2020)]|nr:hypothetical protein [Amycolatopsis sp. H6(2020)]